MIRSFSKILLFIFLPIIAVVAFSCIPYQVDQGPPPTPAETFLKARLTFNALLSDYITQKRAADPATRERWTEDFDPWFERAAIALKAWQAALRTGEGTKAMDAYLEIRNKLMNMILLEI